jgi:drug/metabolite transporter (DMT)-like permease
MLSIYPGSGVASFGFLAPVFGVFLGWALLGEDVGMTLIAALVLVALGIVLINRPGRGA